MKTSTCVTRTLTEFNTFGAGRATLLPLQPSRTLRGSRLLSRTGSPGSCLPFDELLTVGGVTLDDDDDDVDVDVDDDDDDDDELSQAPAQPPRRTVNNLDPAHHSNRGSGSRAGRATSSTQHQGTQRVSRGGTTSRGPAASAVAEGCVVRPIRSGRVPQLTARALEGMDRKAVSCEQACSFLLHFWPCYVIRINEVSFAFYCRFERFKRIYGLELQLPYLEVC
ncbi:hypothetical protein B0T24DRAFT_167397 [Lasiosphaeria ovina]|uniref:Uncharacterized protein n=1 Tax=Lasiosphaeria ovina TaxID=92902 RepID=A0AAE0TSZ9_9PEZI|nr:hypothetical protein B0T24DRAFT_167397 [Lasiosphaeria ovina]